MKINLIAIITSILLVSAATANVVEYTYDDAGNRIEKTNNQGIFQSLNMKYRKSNRETSGYTATGAFMAG